MYFLTSSLVKMLYHMCKKSESPPTWPQLEHAIKRNFGGLELEELDPYEVFEELIPMKREPPNLTEVDESVCLLSL